MDINPEYASYSTVWKVDDNVVPSRDNAYIVQKEDIGKKVSVTITPDVPFVLGEGVKETITATGAVSNDGNATTDESIYFKSWGMAPKISVGGEIVYKKGENNPIRLSSDQTLSIKEKSKLILGDNNNPSEIGNVWGAGTIELYDKNSLVLKLGNIDLKPTAVVKLGDNEVIKGVQEYTPNSGLAIQCITGESPELQRNMISFNHFMYNGELQKEVNLNYDVYMSKIAYDSLRDYTFNKNEHKLYMVEGDEILDTDSVVVKNQEELETELINVSGKKISIKFEAESKINKDIEITNRNVEINGDLVFGDTGNILLGSNTKITLNTGANIEMPKFFVLNNDDSVVSANKGSSLKVGENKLVGNEGAQLSILDYRSIDFLGPNDMMLISIEGSVQVNGFSFSPIVVHKGGSVNLLFTDENNNGIVTSDGGSILINGIPLLANGGPIEPTAGFESTGDIIQLRDKVITLCSNITLNAALPAGFVISTNAFKTDTYSVLVKVEGIPASTLGLEGTLSTGTYTVVDGVWTPNNSKVKDSNQAVDIVAE